MQSRVIVSGKGGSAKRYEFHGVKLEDVTVDVRLLRNFFETPMSDESR
jgi:hypothetical protein